MNENTIKTKKRNRSKLILIICGIILFLIASFIVGLAMFQKHLTKKRIENIKSAELISTWYLTWNASYDRFTAEKKYSNGLYYLIKVDEMGTLTDRYNTRIDEIRPLTDGYYTNEIANYAENEIYLSASLAKTNIKSNKNAAYICGKINDIGFHRRYFDLSFIANEITIYMSDAYLVTEEELKEISEIDTDFYKSYLCKNKVIHPTGGFHYESDPFLKDYLFDSVDLLTENIFNNKQWNTFESKFQLQGNSFVMGDYNRIYFNNDIATVSSSYNDNTYTINYSIKNGILYLNNTPMDVKKISDDYYILYYKVYKFNNSQYLILFDETKTDCPNNTKQQ